MSCVVFHVFFVPFTNFGKNHLVSSKIRPEIVTLIFGKKHRFIGETGRFIGETTEFRYS
jgi:hypothetical protein